MRDPKVLEWVFNKAYEYMPRDELQLVWFSMFTNLQDYSFGYDNMLRLLWSLGDDKQFMLGTNKSQHQTLFTKCICNIHLTAKQIVSNDGTFQLEFFKWWYEKISSLEGGVEKVAPRVSNVINIALTSLDEQALRWIWDKFFNKHRDAYHFFDNACDRHCDNIMPIFTGRHVGFITWFFDVYKDHAQNFDVIMQKRLLPEYRFPIIYKVLRGEGNTAAFELVFDKLQEFKPENVSDFIISLFSKKDIVRLLEKNISALTYMREHCTEENRLILEQKVKTLSKSSVLLGEWCQSDNNVEVAIQEDKSENIGCSIC